MAAAIGVLVINPREHSEFRAGRYGCGWNFATHRDVGQHFDVIKKAIVLTGAHVEGLSVIRKDGSLDFGCDMQCGRFPAIGNDKKYLLSIQRIYARETNPGASIFTHRDQLVVEYKGSYNADYYQSQGEQPNAARPPRHSNIGLACFFFMATAASVFVAFKSAEYADKHGSPWRRLPFLCFLGLAF